MNKRIAEIQESIAAALNALPDVFSTVQWGGRAYKLPGPNGNLKKPKLLAHTWLSEAGDAVGISFKLEKKTAAEVINQYDWISPHSFRTLAPSGWVTAEVRTKTHVKVMIELLKECREQHPVTKLESARRGKPESDVDIVVRRMDSILRERKAAGWSPAFDSDD